MVEYKQEVRCVSEDVITRMFLIILTTFLFVAFLVPVVKKIAFHVGALDIPNSRKVHTKPMPRLGGLAIYFGFLFGYMLFGEPSQMMNSVLIGSAILIFTGIIDDIKPLRALYKLIGQILAASVVTFYGQVLLQDISAFGFYINFGILAYPITIFFIIACINCLNLIDGLDGLAAGISAIYYITIGIIATILGHLGPEVTLTFIMLGATLGFLVHNFHPASIFAGDSGSMFMGFMISIIALLGFKNITLTSFIIPILILAIPILDTLFAIIRRLLKGESISKPDKFHLHHQLLNKNFSHRDTVLIIYAIDALFAFASIVYVLRDRVLGYIIYTVLVVIVLIFVLKTNVIMDHDTFIQKLKNNPKK